MSEGYSATAFGADWQSEFPLHLFPAALGEQAQPITVRRISSLPERAGALQFRRGNLRAMLDGFRYRAAEEATLDAYHDDRVEVLPGPGWTGQLPAAFFSTITALLLAYRGLMPMHGSAVEYEGRGILVCGHAGAGKSTLAAAMIACGARLISDDLSVLHPADGGLPAQMFAGRRTMRLHPGTAAMLRERVALRAEPFESAGKLAIEPPQIGVAQAVPLKTVIIAATEPFILSPLREKVEVLHAHLFRPEWMRRTAGQEARLRVLADAAASVDVLQFSGIEPSSVDGMLELARRGLEAGG